MSNERELVQKFSAHATQRRYTRRQIVRAGAALGASGAGRLASSCAPALAREPQREQLRAERRAAGHPS